MSHPFSPRTPSPPIMHALAAASIALGFGLPYLFVISRASEFYCFSDRTFGYWTATRILPFWTVLALFLGGAMWVFAVLRPHLLSWTLVVSSAVSAVLGGLFVAGFLSIIAPAHASPGGPGASGVPMMHFLLHHLADTEAERKIGFDLCALSRGEGPARYEFCLAETPSLMQEVLSVDPSAKVAAGQAGSGCGPGVVLMRGDARQGNAISIIRRLASLPSIRRIRASTAE